MHIMVYGELVQSPQVRYAKALTDRLPASPEFGVFYSIRKRSHRRRHETGQTVFRNRTQIISFKNFTMAVRRGSLR